jgi:DNA polymerase delta subunit 2
MEGNMLHRHLCCTAPDTLACFPYVDRDPFIIRESPHVYFAGNQAQFAQGKVEAHGFSTTLVSVPAFAKTGIIVLVNLETLQCTPLQFDMSL